LRTFWYIFLCLDVKNYENGLKIIEKVLKNFEVLKEDHVEIV